MDLEVGESYIEPGASATDNVDKEDELSSKIKITGTVNTNQPGTYTLNYNVKDNANNGAVQQTRTVYVLPPTVIATGSTADIGEISIRNAFPGATLKLYKAGEAKSIRGH